MRQLNQPAQSFAIAGIVFGLLLASGCQHHLQPHKDTHATWMNATTLTVLPSRSVACPRKSQPYCVGPMFFGHYNECWRPWPEGWKDASAARCQNDHYSVLSLEFPEEIVEPDQNEDSSAEVLPESTFPPLPSAPLP